MKVLYAPNYEIIKKCALAFGKFDGIHKGHVRLINKLVEEAKKDNIFSVIYTFKNHPKNILENAKVDLLMDEQTKIKTLESLGVDIVIFENFDKDYANITAEGFIKEILVKKLNTKKIVIGSNSTFGKNSEGDIELLKKLSTKYEFKVVEVELLKENGKVLSSSELRKNLAIRGGK